jgi:outer membrane protein assembly factor BamD
VVIDFSRSGRALLLGIALAMALTYVACSHPGKGLQTGSYERGMAEFEGERWYDAVETLKLFVRRNPTDPRVDEAQYHIGMARFEDEDLPVAAVEFEILRRDYPDSPLVEDAWYMEGLCYVRQVPPIHREQAVTRKGIAHFERYLQSFPQGRRSGDAQRELRALQRHLDEKDLAAVRLYRRLGRDEAARITLDVVLENRPQSELRPEMLYLAGELHRDLEQPDRARARWSALVTEFPDHDLARRAQQDLRDLPAEAQRAEGSGR